MSSLYRRPNGSPQKFSFNSRFPEEKKPPTPRELQVAKWIGRAKTNEQIGKLLGCRKTTVKKHVQNLLEKLGLENRLGICAWCHGEGKDLLPKDDQDAV